MIEPYKQYRDEVANRWGYGAQMIADPRSLVAPSISIGVDCGPRRDSSVVVHSVAPLVIDKFHRWTADYLAEMTAAMKTLARAARDFVTWWYGPDPDTLADLRLHERRVARARARSRRNNASQSQRARHGRR